MFDTQSELDFSEFCRRQGWVATKLGRSETPGVQTADFIVKTQTGYELVVEVTEFEPEPPLKTGQIRVRGHPLGDPLRIKLNEKKRQVSNYSESHPTLIVISATFDHYANLEPVSFDSALYGEMTIAISLPNNPALPASQKGDIYNAGRRFFGAAHNTSVSAVAALDRIPHALRIYHNRFAKRP